MEMYLNKIGFAFSGVLAITGILILMKTSMINLILPQIGRIAYQFATAGSYNPNDYHIEFVYVNMAAVFLIGLGIIYGYRFYKKEEKK